MDTQNNSKPIIIGLVIVVIVAVAVFLWWKQAEAPVAPVTTVDTTVPPGTVVATPTSTLPVDSSAAIQQSVQGIEMGSLEQEFQAIDKDINAL